MSDDDKKRALARSPGSDIVGVSPNIPQPLSGVSFLNRARYRAYAKEFDAYATVLRKRNEVGEALIQSAKITEEFQQQLVRIEHLPEIRQMEALRIVGELDAELDKATDREMERDLRRLKQREEKATFMANALAAEQRLDLLQNPPQPEAAPTPSPGPSASEQRAARLAQLRRDEADLIAEIKKGYESDADLPDAERELIERVKLKTADLIADLIENFT